MVIDFVNRDNYEQQQKSPSIFRFTSEFFMELTNVSINVNNSFYRRKNNVFAIKQPTIQIAVSKKSKK